MRRLSIILLLAFILAPGCKEEECTPRQHFEIMQYIRETEGHNEYDAAHLASALSSRSNRSVENDIIRSITKICDLHDVSYRAFDDCHAKYGFLNLTYTEEIELFLELCCNQKEEYQDEQGRLFKFVDLKDDLGALSYLSVVIDEGGEKRIDGLTVPDSGFYTEFENDCQSTNLDEVTWSVKTYPGVKTRFVFDVVEGILWMIVKNSKGDSEPVYGKFTFCEISDTCFKEMKVLVNSDFINSDAKVLDSLEYVVHFKESGTILLNGKEQSSIQELVAILNEIARTRDIKVDIVVDDEVPWTKALQLCSQLSCSVSLHRTGRLEALEKARLSR